MTTEQKRAPEAALTQFQHMVEMTVLATQLKFARVTASHTAPSTAPGMLGPIGPCVPSHVLVELSLAPEHLNRRSIMGETVKDLIKIYVPATHRGVLVSSVTCIQFVLVILLKLVMLTIVLIIYVTFSLSRPLHRPGIPPML